MPWDNLANIPPAGACQGPDCMSAPWPLAIAVAVLIMCALGHELGKDLVAHFRRKRVERRKWRGL